MALVAALLVLGFSLGVGPGVALGHEGVTPPDAQVEGSSSSGSVTTRSASAQVYTLPDGSSVHMQVDSEYSGSPVVGRALAVLASIPHGSEMNRVTVVLTTQSGVQQSCGWASSCYFPSQEKIVVPGDPDAANLAMPFEMTVAHEYGHHIERSRNTGDWYATNLGGRHWATYENVCDGVAAGRLFPGDEGAHYWENPGEAFAQAYATMNYPGLVPWWWSFAEPNQGSFAAIREDVADTSPGSTARWTRKLAPGAPRASTIVNASLDGPIEVTLRQPRAARFDLSLLSADGRLLTKARTPRQAKKGKKGGKATVSTLSYSACGARSFKLEVRRRAGKGKFVASINA